MRRVVLDPATTKGGRRGEVFLPARLQTKLRRFLAWKRRVGQAIEPEAPLVAQWRFRWWEEGSVFDRRHNFHSLRHSSVTNIYRDSKDLFSLFWMRGLPGGSRERHSPGDHCSWDESGFFAPPSIMIATTAASALARRPSSSNLPAIWSATSESIRATCSTRSGADSFHGL